MDISADSRLIVTGSADRHVKIWGMDFGDCHRSIYAHEESVTSVQFVGKTHYFFSVSRDGKLKEWDGDKFERIITLDVGARSSPVRHNTEPYFCTIGRAICTRYGQWP